MNGYKNLMTAVLAQQLTDYIKAVKVGRLGFSKEYEKELAIMRRARDKDLSPRQRRYKKTMTRGEEAKYYIFADSKESENYVFGFKFICTYLGLDPERFRQKIKEKREKFWKDIYGKKIR